MSDETRPTHLGQEMPPEVSDKLTRVGSEIFKMLEANDLSPGEGLMILARIAGILEMGLFEAGEVMPGISLEEVHKQICDRIAFEREGFRDMQREKAAGRS